MAAYRPWQLARLSVSLDHLSTGRLIFGAGLGWQAEDFLAVGEDADARIRAEKLEEGLALLRLFWKGEPFSFAGKHYQMKQVQLLPTPVQVSSIPIWCAATWPHRKPLRRAAGFDGLYLASELATGEPLTPADLQEVVAYLRSQRQEASPFDVAFAGVTEANGGALVQSYAQAGATWWLEGIWIERGTPQQMRERIRQGPPRIDLPCQPD
jgi:alkanesulfonate monooxygenase SsuD/methylene tetrahydromethanopterin reductase-like flavin-dependent oxidoreductase (luciferase family)